MAFRFAYRKSLAVDLPGAMTLIIGLFGQKSPDLCGAHASHLWCFKDACPRYDAAHEEGPRCHHHRAVLQRECGLGAGGSAVSAGAGMGSLAEWRDLG
jgi:hypothetical protein